MNESEKAEGIRNWRFRWLEMLFEFSHLEYQKALWIDHKYENAVGWYSEDMCKYFDDLYLDDDYDYHLQREYISHEEFNTIKEFHFELKNYNEEEKSDLEILNDSSWLSIINLGKSSWEKLKNLIKDEQELLHMKGLEENYLK